MGVLQHVRGHGRLAAELARQRPFGARRSRTGCGRTPCEPGRRARDLLDLGLAVDREQANAELVGARDVALLLDGVAIGDAVRRRAGRERHLDLGDRGGVEAGAELGEQRQAPPAPGWPSRRRTPACQAAPWQRSGSCRARRRDRRRGKARRCVAALRRKSRMRAVIGALPTSHGRASRPGGNRGSWVETSRCRAVETRRTRRVLRPRMLPWIGAGEPDPHGRQGWTSLFGVRAGVGGPARPKKPAPSLL